ncbi:response regulator transcription factor [Paenibacillus lignilyticus]|uniref:Helix-turn-helix domain-containing protein n=1 Tax=Paenibacillus lignilyticus TaxID=1172615 RepID=A0ABS5C8Y9_9BACL|nr:helix-turn-helix domain-containing protein [Paenibacillus lignilyticus]MBP3962451.1 helix-turn-helix domain-containing protein [Paenibacillus lignilyticus]
MYRLLIVDDEPAIVDGLVQHFQQVESLELDVCKAYSPLEALAIVKKTKIDLVISDIRMPGKSGLQLADDILFYWPACRIILLTGYSEFDYVYSAIQKNIDNYILKTEGIETIVSAVLAAIDKLDQANQMQAALEQAKQQLTVAEPHLKKQFFEALLLGEKALDLWQAPYFAGLAMKLRSTDQVMMIVGRMDRYDHVPTTYMDKLKLHLSIQDVLRQQLPPHFYVEAVVHDASLLVWFIQPAEDAGMFKNGEGITQWEDISEYLKGMLEPVQDQCRHALNADVSFAISRSAVEWDDAAAEFERLKSSMKKCSLFGQPMSIIHLGDMDDVLKAERPHPAAQLSTGMFNKQLDALQRSLEAGDEPAAAKLTSELYAHVEMNVSSHSLIGMERYYQFVLVIITQMTQVRPSSVQAEDAWTLDLNASKEQLLELVHKLCEQKKEQQNKSEHLIIERIHRFIAEHLGRDLSLARIAEAVYFNPSYLSRFYKQLTGRTLSDYMNATRADAAQQMLEETQMKVNEIALRLGFESPSYFTAFFRKMTGSTPQEFRESVLLRRDRKENRSM